MGYLARVAGFAEVEKDSGIFVAITDGAPQRLFGPNYSLSGRSFLRRLWPAKSYVLDSKKSDLKVYAKAAVLLGDESRALHSDGSTKSKPAYVLRHLLDDRVSSTSPLDPTLRAASEVDVSRPFTITFSKQFLHGTTKFHSTTAVNVQMEWNGTRRLEKGGTARSIFPRTATEIAD